MQPVLLLISWDNLSKLRILSAGPDDLISYKYTLRPPTTKMGLILGFLFPNWHYLSDLFSTWGSTQDCIDLRWSKWISDWTSCDLKSMCCHFWMHKVWSKKAKLMQKGEETARLWIGRFIYLLLSENCLHSNRSWQIKPCLEIERGDTMSSKGLRKANRVREKGSKVGRVRTFNKILAYCV